MKQTERVTVYTDGGCEPNPGTGGWGVVLVCDGQYKELSGGEPQTTNNRMELTAALEALKALRKRCAVLLYTDSQYVKRGITEWMPAWKRKGWKRKTGAVKNLDLWQELDALAQKHDIEWRWVRGHSGDPLNERCDELAGQAIADQREGRRARKV